MPSSQPTFGNSQSTARRPTKSSKINRHRPIVSHQISSSWPSQAQQASSWDPFDGQRKSSPVFFSTSVPGSPDERLDPGYFFDAAAQSESSLPFRPAIFGHPSYAELASASSPGQSSTSPQFTTQSAYRPGHEPQSAGTDMRSDEQESNDDQIGGASLEPVPTEFDLEAWVTRESQEDPLASPVSHVSSDEDAPLKKRWEERQARSSKDTASTTVVERRLRSVVDACHSRPSLRDDCVVDANIDTVGRVR
jgi:hypothetical protein